MTTSPSILWFRQDLRLQDNPAFNAAASHGPVIPVYIWETDDNPWPLGGASQWWLHHSLTALDANLAKKKSRLIIAKGKALEVLLKLAKETGAQNIYWNRRYEPALIERDKEIKNALKEKDLNVDTFNASLLFEPWECKTKQGEPYRVFTPYWKNCLNLPTPSAPLTAPAKLSSPTQWPDSLSCDDLKLLPRIPWDSAFADRWTPGENAALKALGKFLDEPIKHYDHQRDIPSIDGTSSFAPYLHFGEISPRTIWHQIQTFAAHDDSASLRKNTDRFLAEIGWREFAHHLLFHFPHTTTKPLQKKFESFPWENNKKLLNAWQKGQTGYPIVDAGMRQLWTTGWMHNRVRMIVASFLVKDLFINWTEGTKWFWDTLVDADLANNTLGWQWTAGCGADASPFFRVFSPARQGEKFDAKGNYIRTWVPELSRLPDKFIHEPWLAPIEIQKSSGCIIGKNYPQPIVNHDEQRKKALATFKMLKI